MEYQKAEETSKNLRQIFDDESRRKETTKPRVGILGGGIIGVTAAEKIIKDFRNIDVTLLSDKFSPDTTGDVAAGLWDGYLSGKDESKQSVHKWLKESYQTIQQLYFGQNAGLAGISQLSGYLIDNKAQKDLFWEDIVHGIRHLDEDELNQYGDDCKHGICFTSYTAECPKLLPYLMLQFVDMGGKILKYKADSLRELIGKFDVLVNCTGLDARLLVPDPSLIPIRGQIMKVTASWVKTFILDDYNGNYIIPNIDSVILGGTKQSGNYNLSVDSRDAHNIWKECCRLLPSIQRSKFQSHHVGLRPGRFRVRLERETLFKTSDDKMEVIHNYGHGGCGISLSWGCASDVATHLNEYFRSGPIGSVSSKL